MAAAQTGSGKTLAYLIPLMNRLLRVYPYEAMQTLRKTPSRQCPSGLVLAPTRELVQQIQTEVAKLCYRTFLRSVAVFGGERPGRQAHELSLGCHIVVATPGRLLDFLRQDLLALNHCRSLVVDEADRLLDMGFEEQLREILQSPKFGMPPPRGAERQTCFYSATFPRDVTLLARNLLRGSRCISLTLSDENSGIVVPEWGKTVSQAADGKQQLDRLIQIVPKEIKQRFELVEEDTVEALHQHLTTLISELTGSTVQSDTSSNVAGSGNVSRVLVFCNTKREVDTIDAALYRGGLKSAALHGDKPQTHRTQALHLFRKGIVRILVASSVASRGLDIPNVTAVVNVGPPPDADDYVHRIGRTGRMGQPGEAITVVNETLLNRCSPSILRNILRIVQSSEGGLDSVPKPIVQFVKRNSSNLDSFESHSDYSPYQKRRSSSFGRQRFDRSSNELNRRYS
ncbi:unnamed protein product [Dicrocoelium dendriticum]|nr:unnamed protein product [Dicrocoelium dendriticum]